MRGRFVIVLNYSKESTILCIRVREIVWIHHYSRNDSLFYITDIGTLYSQQVRLLNSSLGSVLR